ncbi:10600_t:CDS:2, partial [Dentiscutata heterogama]
FDTDSSDEESDSTFSALTLFLDQTFFTWDDAQKFLDSYGLEKGFSIRRKRTEFDSNKVLIRVGWECSCTDTVFSEVKNAETSWAAQIDKIEEAKLKNMEAKTSQEPQRTQQTETRSVNAKTTISKSNKTASPDTEHVFDKKDQLASDISSSHKKTSKSTTIKLGDDLVGAKVHMSRDLPEKLNPHTALTSTNHTETMPTDMPLAIDNSNHTEAISTETPLATDNADHREAMPINIPPEIDPIKIQEEPFTT